MKHAWIRKFTFLSCSLFSLSALAATSQAESLSEKLLTKSEQSKLQVPVEAATIMNRSIHDLQQQGLEQKAPKIGDSIPDATVLNYDGEKTSLYETIGDRNAILTFYRGGWCPYCNIQLQAYAEMNEQFVAQGAVLVAISPELPSEALSTAEKNVLTFPVLSDTNNEFARQIGIVFELSEDLQKVYSDFGIDLEKNQGTTKWELPLSATFVINKDRRVTYAFVDADYKKRAEPEILLEQVKRIK
jgi:peroxiredoxin